VAALIGATLAVPAPAAAQPAAAISWGPCAPAEIATVPSEERFRFSCATHVVPLDYDHPDRGSITLALMRRSANDQAHRIGSLFLNPGGPGVSGYRLPTTPTRFLQQRVADRFDLIGFDPRGVARSTPLRCFLTEEDADAVFARLELLIPLTPQEERQTLDALRDYWGFCDRFAGPLLDEMSTKNVALDLDRLRAAVGDVTLNYVGLSYGTMIGAT
jgi:pimeloyl-ACP methyl ester carboxylesterase